MGAIESHFENVQVEAYFFSLILFFFYQFSDPKRKQIVSAFRYNEKQWKVT